MVLAHLKKARIAVSLLFFILTAAVLLDFTSVVPPAWTRTILFLQFAPSLINFVGLISVGTIGFAVVAVLTLLFGRVYCSTICPLGTFQDVVSFLARKIRKTKFHDPIPAYRGIHYAFLVLTLLPLATGSIIAVNLLDPFSNFGRMIGNLFRPLLIFSNNGLASLLEMSGWYVLFPVALKGITLSTLLLPALFFTVIVWMSFQHGRLYCNSICPVGSLLRILSKFSLVRIVIDEESCKGCQLCQRVCKAGCIDRNKKTVDFERCVGCYNCLTACPSAGLSFTMSVRTKRPKLEPIDAPRRSFLLGTSLLFLGSETRKDTTKVIKPKKDSTVPVYKKFPVSPPGSVSIKQLSQSCTACHVCVSSCPSQVLQPALFDYGPAGILQPRMDFDASYCNFECIVCADVCPNGAIRPISVEQKKLTQLGRAYFVKDNCVVVTENTDCGACSEHCPTKAVTMIPYKTIRIPEVKSEYCIGCGACEHACPTRPYRAIYVDGNPFHLVADKKPTEKKQVVDLKEDFPF